VKKSFLFILVLSFILVLTFCSQQKSKWEGTIEEVNGVTIVKNPLLPIYTEDVFFLEEELVIKEEGEDYYFSNLIGLAVNDEKRIFTIDYQAADVKVFDKEGMYIKTIGKRGQGPGEFSRPYHIFVSSQKEVVIFDLLLRRFSYFTFEGEFIKNVSTANYNIGFFNIDSEGNIIGLIPDRNPENPVYALRKFDSDLNPILTYVTSPYPNPQIYNPFGPRPQWALSVDNEIIHSFPEFYEIRIFDAMGKEIRRIIKEYEPMRVSSEMKDLAKKQVERLGESIRLELPEYYPPIRYISVDENKRIFVHTSDLDETGGESVYDVFDPEGKFITRINLMNLPRVWKNNKLYMIEQNKDGFQMIKRYKVTWAY